MFPPEIVQLVVDQLDDFRIQQFLSVSQAFRYSVSKVIFRRIRIHAYPRPKLPHHPSHLLDIFSNNKTALSAVRVVELILPSNQDSDDEDTDDDSDDEEEWSVEKCIVHQANDKEDCPGARDPNLAAVIALLATVPVEELSISSRGQFCNMSDLSPKEIDAMVALRACASLTTLSLDDIVSVPPPIVFGIPSKDCLSSLRLGQAEWSYSQYQIYVEGATPPCVCDIDMDDSHAPSHRRCNNCLPSLIQAHAELNSNVPVLPQLQNLTLSDPYIQCLSPPRDLDAETIAKCFSFTIPRLQMLHVHAPEYAEELGLDDYYSLGHLLKRTPALESLYLIDDSIGELFTFDEEGTSPLQPLHSFTRLRELQLGDRDCSLDNDGIHNISQLFYRLQPFSGPLEKIELEFQWTVESLAEATYVFDVDNAWDELGTALKGVKTLKSVHVHVEVWLPRGFSREVLEDAVDNLRAASEAAVESLGHEGLMPSQSSYFQILYSGLDST